MARKEITDRYVGQAAGAVWAVIHPLFMMTLYVFIFAVVFRMRIGGTAELPRDYTTYLLSGLVGWLGFQEAMTKSCTAITGNAALVKQVTFPLEILPVKVALAALFPQAVSLTALTIYVTITAGLPLTYLMLPILIIMQLMAMVGIGFVLAPIGAYFRDIKDVVQLFTLAGVYLMPVFYLPAMVPSLFKPILYLNPFSYLVWCYQDALYFGAFKHPWAWAITAALSMSAFVLGYRAFRKLKPLLGNIL